MPAVEGRDALDLVRDIRGPEDAAKLPIEYGRVYGNRLFRSLLAKFGPEIAEEATDYFSSGRFAVNPCWPLGETRFAGKTGCDSRIGRRELQHGRHSDATLSAKRPTLGKR